MVFKIWVQNQIYVWSKCWLNITVDPIYGSSSHTATLASRHQQSAQLYLLGYPHAYSYKLCIQRNNAYPHPRHFVSNYMELKTKITNQVFIHHEYWTTKPIHLQYYHKHWLFIDRVVTKVKILLNHIKKCTKHNHSSVSIAQELYRICSVSRKYHLPFPVT